MNGALPPFKDGLCDCVPNIPPTFRPGLAVCEVEAPMDVVGVALLAFAKRANGLCGAPEKLVSCVLAVPKLETLFAAALGWPVWWPDEKSKEVLLCTGALCVDPKTNGCDGV